MFVDMLDTCLSLMGMDKVPSYTLVISWHEINFLSRELVLLAIYSINSNNTSLGTTPLRCKSFLSKVLFLE